MMGMNGFEKTAAFVALTRGEGENRGWQVDGWMDGWMDRQIPNRVRASVLAAARCCGCIREGEGFVRECSSAEGKKERKKMTGNFCSKNFDALVNGVQ